MKCNNKGAGCSLDMGRGADFCNCGDEACAKVCEGCFKLHTTDWLEGMPNLYDEDIFEVRFKNTRRGYYKNVNELPLQKGDIVAVEASPGHDIGIVSLTGDIVARQMKRVGFNPQNGEFRKIYRKAKPYDIEKWQEAIGLEHETMIRSRQIAAEMGLNMKIGDVEYQGDRVKAIFYYIADERVDFRELIKVFAEQFRIRIEMKQIGARQEAGRIGGLGSCGRELCCASWIANFVSVTTNAARVQEISLNPQKLAGQCSKLKCCLAYELDNYLDARKELPRVNQPLQALDGEYYLVKTDILARTMSFGTSPNAIAGAITLPVERVREILAVNKRGQKVDSISDMAVKALAVQDPGFVNVIGEESITRFDASEGERNRSRKGRKRSGGGNNGSNNGNGSGSSSGNSQGSGQGNNNGNRNDRPRGENSRNASNNGQQNGAQNSSQNNPQNKPGRRDQRGRPGGNRSDRPNDRSNDKPGNDRGDGNNGNSGRDNRGGGNNVNGSNNGEGNNNGNASGNSGRNDANNRNRRRGSNNRPPRDKQPKE